MRKNERGIHEPLDDFAFGDAFANVGELESVEDFASSEKGVSGVEVSAEERTTDETVDSNGDLHHDHDRVLNTRSDWVHESII